MACPTDAGFLRSMKTSVSESWSIFRIPNILYYIVTKTFTERDILKVNKLVSVSWLTNYCMLTNSEAFPKSPHTHYTFGTSLLPFLATTWQKNMLPIHCIFKLYNITLTFCSNCRIISAFTLCRKRGILQCLAFSFLKEMRCLWASWFCVTLLHNQLPLGDKKVTDFTWVIVAVLEQSVGSDHGLKVEYKWQFG